jgi:hypothetical protein
MEGINGTYFNQFHICFICKLNTNKKRIDFITNSQDEMHVYFEKISNTSLTENEVPKIKLPKNLYEQSLLNIFK